MLALTPRLTPGGRTVPLLVPPSRRKLLQCAVFQGDQELRETSLVMLGAHPFLAEHELLPSGQNWTVCKEQVLPQCGYDN
jgi:hypothetical protein